MSQQSQNKPVRESKKTAVTTRLRRVSPAQAEPIISDLNQRQCPECGRMHPHYSNFCSHDGTRLPEAGAPVDPRIGQIIDNRLTITAKVGEGGLGTVYRAKHVKLDQDVAVKLLHPSVSADPVQAARFLREAQVSSCMNHENVIDVIEYGKTPQGELYLVMELLRGRTVAQVLETKRFVSLQDCVRIVSQVCEGLHHAHELGLVHRDLKPENIFMLRAEQEGQELVKILDFGLARDTASRDRLTRAGMLCGTPAYVSPKQAHGRPLDARSDVYALGIVTYELLTGEVPFDGDSPLDVLVAQAKESPRPMADVNAAAYVPPEVEAVVFKALAKSPGDRYDTAIDFQKALTSALFGNPTREPGVPNLRPVGKARIRRKQMDKSRIETVLELNAEDFIESVLIEDDPSPVDTPTPRIAVKPGPALNRAETVVAPMDFDAVRAAVAAANEQSADDVEPGRAKAIEVGSLRTAVIARPPEIQRRRRRSDTEIVPRSKTASMAVQAARRRRVRMRRMRYVKLLAAALLVSFLASAGAVFAFSGPSEPASPPTVEQPAPTE